MDVFTKTYPAPPYDKEEIFRYAGIKGDAGEFTGLTEECLGEAEGKFSFRVCYARFPVSVRGDSVDLAFAATRSSALAKNLAGCAFACVALCRTPLATARQSAAKLPADKSRLRSVTKLLQTLSIRSAFAYVRLFAL